MTSGAAPNVIAFPGSDSEDPEELFLVTPGPYNAVYERHAGIQIFTVRKLRVWFRLLEHPGIVLERWWRVTSYKGRIAAPAKSDIVREISAALGQKIRPDRIPVGSLANVTLRVMVKTVTTDQRQRKLNPINHYSVIESLEGRA